MSNSFGRTLHHGQSVCVISRRSQPQWVPIRICRSSTWNEDPYGSRLVSAFVDVVSARRGQDDVTMITSMFGKLHRSSRVG